MHIRKISPAKGQRMHCRWGKTEAASINPKESDGNLCGGGVTGKGRGGRNRERLRCMVSGIW